MIKDILESNEEVTFLDRDIAILKENFPGCFNKNGVFDIQKLENRLKEKISIDREGYELNFLGKNYAKLLASTETTTVIKPDEAHNNKEENIMSDNLYLTGDNLDTLKHLLKSYSGKIKCIYIDPPYNTGSDGFTYNDKFNFKVDELAEKLSIDEDKAQRIIDMTSRGDSSHSAWLTFMYPRILLARDLLKDDGVIFISIDENEQSNLKLLCDDIFGEENYAGEIIWKNSSKNDQSFISIQHEYILSYTKHKNLNSGEWTEKKEGLDEIFKAFDDFKKIHGNNWDEIHREALKWFKQFPESNPISLSKHYNWMDEKGVYFPADISGPNFGQYRYDVIHPTTGKICKEPASGWRYPEETMKQRIKDNLVHFGKDETTIPNNKTYLKNTQYQSLTSIKYKDGRVASKKLNELLGGKYFTNPKDVDLLSMLFKAVKVENDDIVLDFFSGSGTTANAIMNLNSEDNGNRRFIMVQIPEKTKENSEAMKAGYETINQIGIKRIELSANKIKEETGANIDYGFKHYELCEPGDNTLDKIENFNPYLIDLDKTILEEFGVSTIVTTWAVKDGYGFNADIKAINLGGYIAYHCKNHIYLVNPNITDENIINLIEKFEEDNFNPENLVIFGYSFIRWTQIEMIKNNIKQLNNSEKNLKVNVYTRY